jgi:hypothetical protein
MHQAMVALDSKHDMTKAEWRYLQYHAFNDLRERLAQPEQEPVAAQHRFRHPEKTMPDWSKWQECKVSNRPAWEIDSQGYEVEYRNLYTPPPEQERREWQGLFFDAVYEAWHSAGMDVLGGDWNTFASKLEEKLKETK